MSVMGDCKVDTKSYSTNDGLVIAQVAHIINFSAKCSGKDDGIALFADVNGKTIPAIKSIDGKSYQISWTEELAKSRSASFEIPVYDEEGFAQLRKAQRGGGDASGVPNSLFSLTHNYYGTYKGPWIQTELVAAIAAVALWWFAYTNKAKLTA